MGQTIKTNSWVPTPRMPVGNAWVVVSGIGVSPDPEEDRVAMSSQIPDPDSHQLQNVGDLFFWVWKRMESKSATLGDFWNQIAIIIIVPRGVVVSSQTKNPG